MQNHKDNDGDDDIDYNTTPDFPGFLKNSEILPTSSSCPGWELVAALLNRVSPVATVLLLLLTSHELNNFLSFGPVHLLCHLSSLRCA